MSPPIIGSPTFSNCRVCGWATLPGSALCVGCLDIREWSRVNRAFCDLLHRTKSADAHAEQAELYAAPGLALTA